MGKFFLALQALGILSSWFTAAMRDGKITSREAVELVEQMASMLGFDLEWDFSDDMPPDLADAKSTGRALGSLTK